MSNFVIDDEKTLKDKIKMLNSLKDIRVTASLAKQAQKKSSDENPIDQKYKSLNCKLTPIDPNSDKFKFLSTYLNENKGGTHSSHKCLEIFEVERDGEKSKFKEEINNH